MEWSKKVVLFENKQIEIDVLELCPNDLEEGSMFHNLECGTFMNSYYRASLDKGCQTYYVPESCITL